MTTKHDLIFFEKRSTPKVITQGMKFTAPETYGKQTKRRPATEDEEKQISKGQWVRVDEKGTKGGQPGYKKTKMVGREHLVKHDDVDVFLSHHGVMGMKWGVRNNDGGGSISKTGSAPKSISARREKAAKQIESKAVPYQKRIDQLNAMPKANTARGIKNHEAFVKNATRERDKQISSAQKVRDGKLTPRQKNLIAGAAIVVGVMAAYGAYKYVDSGEFNQMKNKGLAFITGKAFEFKRNNSLMGKMSAEDIYSKVVSKINPNYGSYGTKMNCRRATYAYELRRRGFDVKATLSNAGTGQNQLGLHNAMNPGENLPTGPLSMFKAIVQESYANKNNLDPGSGRPKLGAVTNLIQNVSPWGKNHIPYDVDANAINKVLNDGSFEVMKEYQKVHGANVAKGVFKSLATNPDGARGELGMAWTAGGGHSMAWEKINGKVHIFDNQSGKHYPTPESFREFAGSVNEAAFTRLDNVALNSDFLQRWVTNV